MSGTTTLTVDPCPFCGAPPAAQRVALDTPATRPNNRKMRPTTDVVIGCSSAQCDATIIVRGASFGDAVIRWNNRPARTAMMSYRLDIPTAASPRMVAK